MHEALTLIVSDVAGGYRDTLKGRIDGLHVSTQTPGGDLALSFRVLAPTHTVPPYLGANFDVRLVDAEGVVARYRMEDVIANLSGNSEWWEVTALGYAVNLDDQFVASYNASGKATNAVVTDNVTGTTAPQIDSLDVEATGYTLSGATAVTLTNQRVRDIVNWAAEFGNSSDRRMLWHVWTNSAGSRVLEFKAEPAAAEYFLYRRDLTGFQGGFSFKNYANYVHVDYNGGASTTSREDTAAQGTGSGGVGVKRMAYLSIPEITQLADAQQAADVLLARAKQLRMQAQSIRLKKGAVILDSNGQSVAPWRVRSGKIVRLMDVRAATGGLSNLSWNNAFLIVGTEYDDDASELRLTPETFDADISTIVAKARQGRE